MSFRIYIFTECGFVQSLYKEDLWADVLSLFEEAGGGPTDNTIISALG